MTFERGVVVGCDTGKIKVISFYGQPSDVKGTILDSENGVLCIYKAPFHTLSYISETASGRLDWFSVDNNQITLSKIGNVTNPLAGIAFMNESELYTCQKSNGILQKYELSMNKVLSYKHSVDTLTLGNVSRFVGTYQPGIVASGGQKNNLKLWDLNEEKQKYKARNPPHDKLSLAVNIDVTDILVMDERNRIYTSTKQKQIHFFDCQDGSNRALTNVKFGQHTVNVLAKTNDCRQIIAGDCTGTVGLIDIRKPNFVVHHYKGANASIKGLACVNQDMVISTSIDGFVRAYNKNTKELLWNVYMKSRLSCMLGIDTVAFTLPDSLDSCVQSLQSKRILRLKGKSLGRERRKFKMKS